MAKYPWFKFHPGDWRKDPAVQSCEFFDRGVWIEMLCMMHESPSRGKLVRQDGKALSIGEIARSVGLDKQTFEVCLSRLLDAGVCSRDQDDVIFCRRMVREQHISQVRSEAGKLGGNPQLSGDFAYPKSKQKCLKKPRNQETKIKDCKQQIVESETSKTQTDDPLRNLVADLWFGGAVPDTHRPRVGRIVSSLRQLGATPGELRSRHDRYRRQWPTMECTPEALIKHWSRFSAAVAVSPPAGDQWGMPSDAERRQRAEEAERYRQWRQNNRDGPSMTLAEAAAKARKAKGTK